MATFSNKFHSLLPPRLAYETVEYAAECLKAEEPRLAWNVITEHGNEISEDQEESLLRLILEEGPKRPRNSVLLVNRMIGVLQPVTFEFLKHADLLGRISSYLSDSEMISFAIRVSDLEIKKGMLATVWEKAKLLSSFDIRSLLVYLHGTDHEYLEDEGKVHDLLSLAPCLENVLWEGHNSSEFVKIVCGFINKKYPGKFDEADCSVDGARIGNAHLRIIANQPLKKVNLRNCPHISLDGIRPLLQNCSTLQTVTIEPSEDLSREDIQTLQNEFPHITFEVC